MKAPPFLCLAASVVAASASLFPPVSELDPALLMPPDSETVEIARDGNFLVDGRPRYLLGTILYHTPSDSDCKPGPGYEPENAWIYETIPDRDYLQRIGFDTVGGEVSGAWMQAFRPEKEFYQGRRVNDWSLATRYWKSGLPTIVDFTCASWSHGGIRFQEGREPSRVAIPEGGAGHFMPYSLVTKEGRDLYARMWRSGAEELRDHDVHPYAYELFNEPTYEDRSPEARAAFAGFLSKRFGGDAAAMDAVFGSSYGSFEAAAAFKHPNEFPGLGVAWLRFRERCFLSGIRLGLKTIRAVDPDARVCFQPLGISFGMVNLLAANRPCGVVMSPTGGGDLYDTLLLRAIADGKPIIDGETYLGHTRASHRAKIVTQWSRGFNASYYFKWDRRRWDPVLKQENGEARLAEMFPWLGLHPPCTPTEALAGLMDAKRDIFAMEDLFGPRDRGLPPEKRAAFLVSQPTERLGSAAGHANHAFARASAMAMARDAHLPLDAVFEEQLREGRLDRYRVLVAAGVDATLPSTLPALRRWVEAGGTLVLEQESMDLDEWNRPVASSRDDFPGIALGTACKAEAQRFEFRGASHEAVPYREASFAPDSPWQVVAELPGGHPAVARRDCGKGCVWYVGVRFPTPGDEGRFLAALAADCGVAPTCETQDPDTRSPVDGIEVQAVRGAGDDVGFVVANRTLSARAVRFLPRGDFAIAAGKSRAESAENAEGPLLLDVTRNVALAPDADGAFLLLLEPGIPVVLRSEPSHSSLVTRHPSPTLEPYSEVLARLPVWLAEHTPKAAAKAFSVDPARVRFLDLKAVANRSYGDRIAGDGEGGWTDQGENHLRHAPWGVTDCNGVPFDFIRPDQNDDRACVILRSTRQPYLPEAVRGIAANLRAEALYFLHAGAWIVKGEEAFRYVVHYADGTSLAVPMIGRRDFDDWWIDSRRAELARTARCVPGWTNSEGRGFHVLRWENPHPDKTLATIDIESACTGTIPIIEAITAELPDESPFAARRLQLRAWGGVKAAVRDGAVELCVDDATLNWAGAGLRPRQPVPLPADPDEWDVVFEANGGRTPLGRNDVGGQPFQVASEFALAGGGGKSGPYILPEIEGGSIDGDPLTWQTVRMPLRRLLPKGADATALASVSVQFRVFPAERAGMLVRRIRFERTAETGDAGQR